MRGVWVNSMSALLPLFLTLIFVGIAFFPYQSTIDLHPLITYFVHELGFIKRYVIWIILGFLGLNILLTHSYKVHKKFPYYKKFIFSLFHLSLVTLTSFFLALVALFVLAFFQLNASSFFVTGSPGFVGIKTDLKEVVKALKNQREPLRILLNDEEDKKVVMAVGYAATGRENFYGRFIISTFPSSLIIPMRNVTSSIALVNNELIISDIKQRDLQLLSPYIGYLFVKQYFPTKKINQYPKISILPESDYQKYRQDDAKRRLAAMELQLTRIEASLSALTASVTQSKEFLETEEPRIADAVIKRDIEYKRCQTQNTRNATRQLPQTNCEGIKTTWDATIVPGRTQVARTKETLTKEEKQLSEYQYFQRLFTRQKAGLTVQTKNLSHELGVFMPKDKIGVLLKDTNKESIADYFATVTHEYLHYASYIPGRKFNAVFFEEGLTEYFARQTIQRGLGEKTNLGYPAQVILIKEMTRLIPESELAQIYFRKDEAALQAAINRVYGDGFYRNNIVQLETIQYTGNTKKLVELTNEMLVKLGGSPISEKDVVSSFSQVSEN